MAPIATFVFLDFGTEYNNAENVTEVGMLATPRALILDPNLEEPTDQLIMDLSNATVEDYEEIVEFINRQEKPVSLVAHNGNRFDFIILMRELQEFNLSLPDDVLCADSLYAFYDILENPQNVDMVYTGNAVRNFYFENAGAPAVSYQLGQIYERVVAFPPVEAHPVENDIIMIFRISRNLGERFLAWTDQIQRNFAEVEVEEIYLN